MRDQQRARLRRSEPNCHICGLAIDYKLPHTEPKSFVIDHVIPLDRGGKDTASNLRAAHRDCNSAKRARIVPNTVRRSGSLD